MALLLLMILFSIGNQDFHQAVKEQKAAGYKWHELKECRIVTPGLPALTIDSVKGKRVCYKLALTTGEAK